jgi:hypothetical protein
MRSYAMPDAPDTPPRVAPRAVFLVFGVLVVILMAVGAFSFVRYARRAAPNPNLIAIAPFDIYVAGRDLEGWRVRLAEALTAELAAAPLETVPQARVRERWKSAPTPEIAAVELARRTSAGTALYGRVDSAGRDSVIVRLVVAEASSSRVMFGVIKHWPIAAAGETGGPEGLARALAEQVRAHHPVTRRDSVRDSI